jgi:hypothetical protein
MKCSVCSSYKETNNLKILLSYDNSYIGDLSYGPECGNGPNTELIPIYIHICEDCFKNVSLNQLLKILNRGK